MYFAVEVSVLMINGEHVHPLPTNFCHLSHSIHFIWGGHMKQLRYWALYISLFLVFSSSTWSGAIIFGNPSIPHDSHVLTAPYVTSLLISSLTHVWCLYSTKFSKLHSSGYWESYCCPLNFPFELPLKKSSILTPSLNHLRVLSLSLCSYPLKISSSQNFWAPLPDSDPALKNPLSLKTASFAETCILFSMTLRKSGEIVIFCRPYLSTTRCYKTKSQHLFFFFK